MELPALLFLSQSAFSVWRILYWPSPLPRSTSWRARQEMDKETSVGKGARRGKPAVRGGNPKLTSTPTPMLCARQDSTEKELWVKRWCFESYLPVSLLVKSGKKFFAFNTPLGYVEFNVPQRMSPLSSVIDFGHPGGACRWFACLRVWELAQSSWPWQQLRWCSLTLDNWSPWVLHEDHPTWSLVTELRPPGHPLFSTWRDWQISELWLCHNN